MHLFAFLPTFHLNNRETNKEISVFAAKKSKNETPAQIISLGLLSRRILRHNMGRKRPHRDGRIHRIQLKQFLRKIEM